MTFNQAVQYLIDNGGADLSAKRPTVDELNTAVNKARGNRAITINRAITAGRVILDHWTNNVPVSREEAHEWFKKFGTFSVSVLCNNRYEYDQDVLLLLCARAVFLHSQPVECVQGYMRALLG